MLSSKKFVFFFQAEDGMRDLVRSRGLGDVYKRQERNPQFGVNFWSGVAAFASGCEQHGGGGHGG